MYLLGIPYVLHVPGRHRPFHLTLWRCQAGNPERVSNRWWGKTWLFLPSPRRTVGLPSIGSMLVGFVYLHSNIDVGTSAPSLPELMYTACNISTYCTYEVAYRSSLGLTVHLIDVSLALYSLHRLRYAIAAGQYRIGLCTISPPRDQGFRNPPSACPRQV